MSDRDTELLQRIVDLLTETATYRRKALGDAVDKLRSGPDRKKDREESNKEARLRADERRREDVVRQEAVLAELRSISQLLKDLLSTKE